MLWNLTSFNFQNDTLEQIDLIQQLLADNLNYL